MDEYPKLMSCYMNSHYQLNALYAQHQPCSVYSIDRYIGPATSMMFKALNMRPDRFHTITRSMEFRTTIRLSSWTIRSFPVRTEHTSRFLGSARKSYWLWIRMNILSGWSNWFLWYCFKSLFCFWRIFWSCATNWRRKGTSTSSWRNNQRSKSFYQTLLSWKEKKIDLIFWILFNTGTYLPMNFEIG
mgnify:CR=1 FL=1